MSVPTFRFVAWSDGRPTVDAQFWRDADASDRLASRSEANRFLRELCRSRAWEDACATGEHGPRRLHEAALLREVLARGYRLSGTDLETLADSSQSPDDGGFGDRAPPPPSTVASRTHRGDEKTAVRAAQA